MYDITNVHEACTTVDGFVWDDMHIHNPFWSDCGRFEVDPVETYGDDAAAFLERHPNAREEIGGDPSLGYVEA